MQRRAQYSSSGELDVFGATRYFDGLADLAAGPVTVRQPQDVMIQVKDMHHKEGSYRSTQELGSKSRSNLAFFFGYPAESFRENPPASSSTTSGIHNEPPQVSSSSPVAACDRDLGELVGDRRLQGVRVVRRVGGDEERWVVRCGGHALEEEQHHVHGKIVHAKSSDDRHVGKTEHDHEKKIIVDATLSDGHQVEDGDDWGSDTSSDLFELDLEDPNNR